MKQKIKILKNKLDLGKQLNYKFNKPIFWIALVFLIIPIVLFIPKYGLATEVYYCCPNTQAFCENIFLECSKEPLRVGCDSISKYSTEEYLLLPQIKGGECLGSPPPYHIKNYPVYMFCVILLAFFFNHLKNIKELKNGRT